MRAAADACFQRDPPGVPAHHFENHDALVTAPGGHDAVERIDGDLHGGLKAEGVVGAFQIVVDGFGDAHHRNTQLVQVIADFQCAFATDHEQAVEVHGFEVVECLL